MKSFMLGMIKVLGCVSLLSACTPYGNLKNDSKSKQFATSDNWDVNDISVLYPLRNRFAGPSEGRLVRLTDGNGLMSQEQFASVLRVFQNQFGLDYYNGSQASFMNTLDKWVVTAFRLDHCFKRKLSDSCTPQVRIVAQAVPDNEMTTTDFSLHLFYEPEQSTLQLLEEMIRIRKENAAPELADATLGKPLGVHPILGAKGGLSSKFAGALKNEFLLKYLSPKNLTQIAVAFIEPDRLQPWIFFRDEAQSFSKAQDNSIFAFDPETSKNRCGVETGRLICRRDLNLGHIVDSQEKQDSNPRGFTPAGRTADSKPYLDDFLTLIQKDTDTKNYSSVSQNLSYWEDVFNEIENPEKLAPGDTNCASCHRTQTDRVRMRGIFTLNPTRGDFAFDGNNNSGCTPGIGIDYSQTGIKTFNVRMFGYMHERPIVGQRVANESVKVCKELKAQLR